MIFMFFSKSTLSRLSGDGIKFILLQQLEITPSIMVTPIRMNNPEVHFLNGVAVQTMK